MADNQEIPAWIDRLQHEIPGAVAVILKGSHARGGAGEFSDIDFDVLIHGEPREEYLAYFEEDDAGRLRHVSVAVQDVTGWLAGARDPVAWSYGLPAAETTRLVWARDDSLRWQLDRPARMHPPEAPELEDFIECWGKIRNAFDRGDDLQLRLAAQKLARLCPTLLRPLNPEVRPENRIAAMQAVLAFPVAPDGYRDDLLRCFGLAGTATSLDDLRDSARRLVLGTISLLMEHASTIEPLLPGDLAEALTDGRLARYVRQIEGGADAGA